MKAAILLGLLFSAVVVKAGRCVEEGHRGCLDVDHLPQKHLLWKWHTHKNYIRDIEEQKGKTYGDKMAVLLPKWRATLAELEERIRKDLPKVWAKINGPMAAKETLAELKKRICDELPEDCEDFFINGRMAAMEQRRAAFNRQMAAMKKQRAAFNRQTAAFNRQMAAMDK